MKGDCLSCSRLGNCAETSVEKVLSDFTCVLYEPVEEPVYLARAQMMEKFGEALAVQAMLERPEEPQEEGEKDE
jgi:hypothetical protein